ncbi:MAG TPA: sterol desaturase family protein [Polyangiaceae bacterium]|nr:sterol desaturase family protein [Polyangiaceae bacterium]
MNFGIPCSEPPAPIADAAGETRASLLRFIPPGYSPARHLAAMSLGCPAAVALLARAGLGEARGRDWLAVPATLLAGTLVEYVAHRWVMHRPGLLALAYDAHAGRHHRFYTARSMTYGHAREIWLVLFSAKDVAILAACVAPFFAALGLVITPGAHALSCVTAAGFFLLYEWLHLACHLPERAPLARLAPLRWLRAAHARHHDEAGPGRNYGVTTPLWDMAFGTRAR